VTRSPIYSTARELSHGILDLTSVAHSHRGNCTPNEGVADAIAPSCPLLEATEPT
jgi:hypothetical protein